MNRPRAQRASLIFALMLMLGLAECDSGRRLESSHAPGTIADAVASDARLSALASLLHVSDLAIMLRDPGPFTLFAPTNGAFDRLPEGTRQELFSSMPALTKTLLYHIVPRGLSVADLTLLPEVDTSLGRPLSIESNDTKMRIGSARILQGDIRCSNGVIHVVDAVNVPSPPVASSF
ncbi:MAG: fasciclin domain-containing protein [Candidatus Krumholzibacteria bacterium]|nr:fasciclin domain-containing protein [Candidatus Krumholzibacteria bacterium]